MTSTAIAQVTYNAADGTWFWDSGREKGVADDRGAAWYMAMERRIALFTNYLYPDIPDAAKDTIATKVADQLLAYCRRLPAQVTDAYLMTYIGWRIRDAFRVYQSRQTIAQEHSLDAMLDAPGMSTHQPDTMTSADAPSIACLGYLDVLPDDRCKRIAVMLSEGYTQAEIGRAFHLAPSTISTLIATTIRPAIAQMLAA